MYKRSGPGPGASVMEITRDTESSAFTWLLRAVVSQRGLENTEASLECLAHVMAAQPERMKAHVIRVMLRSVTAARQSQSLRTEFILSQGQTMYIET